MKKALAVMVLLVLVLLAIGIVPRVLNHWRLDREAAKAEARLPRVQLVLPEPVKTTELNLPGQLEAVESTAVGSRTSGTVTRRLVDIGSRVHKGQLLAVVSAPEARQGQRQAEAQWAQNRASTSVARAVAARGRASLAQARAALSRGRASLASAQQKRRAAEKNLLSSQANLKKLASSRQLARVTYDRYQEMGQGGAAPLQLVDEKKSAWQQALAEEEAGRAGVSQAQAQLEAARAEESAARADLASAQEGVQAAGASLEADSAALDAAQAAEEAGQANAERSATLSGFERIVAPMDGVITSRNVDVGSLIAVGSTDSKATVPGAGLFGIARIERVRAVVQAPEVMADRLQLGVKARVEVRDIPNRTFTGAIWKRAGAVDQQSRSLQVEVLLENPGGQGLPGMFCRARFDVPGQAWRLPASALQFDAKNTRVLLVDGENKCHEVPLQVSRDLGNQIQTTYPFKGDERIVADPGASLKEGSGVQILPSPSP